MILLLGATTYVGRAFARALRRRKDSFVPLSRDAFDYTRFEFLFDYVRKIKPDLVINAAESRERATGDCSEVDRTEMFQINTLLPQTIARVCTATNTCFAHISSGSIYAGAKIAENGQWKIQEDLVALQKGFVTDSAKVRGFSEVDAPNCGFNSQNSTFYSGTKALAEEALREAQLYTWRLRLPFNEQDEPGNFLSQLQDGSTIHDCLSSVSQLDECVAACLELWERHAPLGIYNVVNPGPVRTQEVGQMIRCLLRHSRGLQLFVYQEDRGPASNQFPLCDCVLDNSKLLSTGIKLRSASHALEHALQKWVPHTAAAALTSLPQS